MRRRCSLARVGARDSRSIDDLRRRRRLRGPAQGPDRRLDAGEGDRRGQEVGPARPRRRRASPTGVKWDFVPKDTKGKPVYLLCNADESEPGHVQGPAPDGEGPAPAHRGDDPRRPTRSSAARPTSTSAASSTTARASWTRPSRRRTRRASSARTSSAPATRSTSTVHRGAGAYICGEETGLIESLEGKRGQPRIKPPFPAVSGVFARADDRQQRRDARAASRTSSTAAPTGSRRSAATRRTPGPSSTASPATSTGPASTRPPMGLPVKDLIFGDATTRRA